MMKEEHRIHTVKQLREVISEPNPMISNKLQTTLDDNCIDFVSKSPLIFLGTSDAKGRQDVSPKGDAPGFVKVLDETTLVIPERPGNHLALGFLNMLENDHVGVIFVVPGTKETFRVNGKARLSKDPELLEQLSANGKPALLCTIVDVEEVFFHCGKALIRSKLWQPEFWGEDAAALMVKQLANALAVEDSVIESSLSESYKDRLY
ncbi:pyridoxamine 5'-phosphate oxidase family protein [Pseudomaricurvus alkylphenolicus]|jgi:PPOX class probable FMN-dependent enzyme|uniref:MSMEG_1061 family FMN-dependent PPOX-type flavoprotein n=1 Tax=Pseudomaricurvus alkylphenolicus TaxID=1306991 RepID=UPI00141DA2ED|nr:MSMEG_1061 family FMN-dependent PPOX-type flavoprotein [Pseudomaricurvus alkylphenolicus]NIB38649.1 pyridoxamine 5'-phosphate oxidase family protein [Pseudomaricurvus alkylphenolicus]